MSRTDAEDMISLWLSIFPDDSFEAVNTAIISLISKGAKFAPVIGEIKAEMDNGKPKNDWALNRRPYPQSFIDEVHQFLAEEEAAGRYHPRKVLHE